jgi:hypothetical protein
MLKPQSSYPKSLEIAAADIAGRSVSSVLPLAELTRP